MWKVLLHPDVDSKLDGMETEISERIKDKLRELRDDPFHYLEHYGGDDYYKLRVGDYRALIDVDFDENVLRVQLVGHRRNVYKE